MNVPIYPRPLQRQFLYGDEYIPFERVLRQKSNGRLLIKVHPDCRVVVSAPSSASDSDVLAAVKKRGRWIYKQLREFRTQSAYITPRQYISGESHPYLGRQYLLKVIHDPNEDPSVKLFRGKLEVSTRSKSPNKVRDMLTDWYKVRAKEVFPRRLDRLLEHTLWITERPAIRILTMKTQWGSCSPKGLITLNPHLVKAPQECIDYVILHELCHIAEHNHSDRFYRLISQVMPGWENTKNRLDGMANKLVY